MATERVDRAELPERGRMSILEHLAELRRRLVICIVAVTVGAVAVFILWGPIVSFLAGPYRDLTRSAAHPHGKALIFTDPLEGFMVRLKVAGYGGIVVALPVLLWQLWRFVTPGLYPREKRYAVPFLASSLVLFGAGAFVAWLTVPQALSFLLRAGGSDLEPLLSASRYISLVSLMFLAFGIAFEFPVVLVFLLVARVITTATLRRGRRYAAVGLAIFAAVITPSQDPYSMMLLLVPLYLFYEASILIGRLMKR
jgi:sec-independent protein translocase protein TatC